MCPKIKTVSAKTDINLCKSELKSQSVHKSQVSAWYTDKIRSCAKIKTVSAKTNINLCKSKLKSQSVINHGYLLNTEPN